MIDPALCPTCGNEYLPEKHFEYSEKTGRWDLEVEQSECDNCLDDKDIDV